MKNTNCADHTEWDNGRTMMIFYKSFNEKTYKAIEACEIQSNIVKISLYTTRVITSLEIFFHIEF